MAQAPEARSEKRDSIMAKVRKILDLADGTDKQGEKDAALAQASALMARYAIEQAEVDAMRSGTEAEKIIDYGFIIGPNKSPVSGARGTLAYKIAQHNRCTMYHGTKFNHDRWADDYEVHFVGFESDVEWCEMLYTSLSLQMDRAYEAAKGEKREWVNGRTFRKSFNDGFVAEAGRRLRDIAQQTADAVRSDDVAKQEVAQEALEAGEAFVQEPTSGALVLVERREQVDAWVQENLNLRTRYRYSRSQEDGHARQAGSAAASRADYSAGRTARVGGRGLLGA